MDTLQVLQIIWFFLIGILLAGYSVLDGFDLGIGILLPFMAKDKNDTVALFTAIGPVWDGNEVWLLTAGGALFAAFPHAYATVFSGFYLALMLVLFALIFRAVSLEFWSLDEPRRSFWKWAFAIGSLLPSLLFGVALGNVVEGIPLSDSMEFTGSFFTLLRPFPIAVGLTGLSAILVHGCTYAALKTEGPLHDRARLMGKRLWILFLIMLIISAIMSGLYLPGSLKSPLGWIGAAVVIISLVIGRVWMGRTNDKVPFLMTSLSFIGLWGIAGSYQFPHLVKAAGGSGLHLSIYNSSSSELTLTVMLTIAAIGMPMVLVYTVYAYRIFKGKVNL
ncbi:MAG: cytochrome d ubiquinol oxidase subunit II [Spirochaetes bacterium RBG_13_51_14]|nr:MAG: cytochrome d ubiquinol oxidase subunit II [Spirochaetes bacterium RBG_13_51_14]